MKTIIEDLKTDQELRPYFLDFVAKNIELGLTDVFTVNNVDRIRIQKEFYDSMYSLSERLKTHVPNELIFVSIEEVSKYYLGQVGTVSFDSYPMS